MCHILPVQLPYRDTHPLALPSFCGILIETAFSNVDCKASSVALKARLFTTRVLLAAPVATRREGRRTARMIVSGPYQYLADSHKCKK